MSVDREKWNKRYSIPAPEQRHEAYLEDIQDLLPCGGRVLDVAGGWGRNSRFFFARQFNCTIVDVSDVLINKQRLSFPEINWIERDLTEEPIPEGPWDIILSIYFLERDCFQQYISELKPGGYLIVVHPTVKNLERHVHPSKRFLLKEAELLTLCAGLSIIDYREDWMDCDRHLACLLAQK